MHRNALWSIEMYCGKVEDKSYACLCHSVADLLCSRLGNGYDADMYAAAFAEAFQLVDMADGLAVYSAAHALTVAVEAAYYIEAVSLKAVVLQHSPAEISHTCDNYAVMVLEAEKSAYIAHELGGDIAHLGASALAHGGEVLPDLNIVETEGFGNSRCGDISLFPFLGQRSQVIEVHRQPRQRLRGNVFIHGVPPFRGFTFSAYIRP